MSVEITCDKNIRDSLKRALEAKERGRGKKGEKGEKGEWSWWVASPLDNHGTMPVVR